jgi:hypothetical protein
MKYATRVGRLAGLAVGLGIGAALAATPGTASADPASPVDANDVAGASSAAVGAQPDLPPFDPSNLAISVDGITLYQTGTATATSGGLGDIAIADGAGADAISNGGPLSIGDFAYAQGNAIADSAGGSFDTATAVGNGAGSYAFGDFDTAAVTGNDAEAKAVAGFFETATVVQTGSSYDEAVAAGPGLGVFGAFNDAHVDGTGSIATAGDPDGSTFGGFDIASVVGDGSTATAGDPGNFDLATVTGDMLNAIASGGNFLSDIMP